MKRGQTWAIDLGISIVLFTVAMVVTYALLENTLEETAYADVREQALDASDLLLSEGFPNTWTNNTVLRAGLLSDGVLSMRKAREIALLPDEQLRSSMRSTDHVAFTLQDVNDTLQAVFGTCAVGDLTISEIPGYRTLTAFALTRGAYPVASNVNATIFTDANAYAVIDDADILLLEGNLSSDSTLTPVQIARALEAAAARGITVVIVGDPGVSALGLQLNDTNATNITVTADASSFGFTQGSSIDLPGASPVGLRAIITPPSVTVVDYRALAMTDTGYAALATWVYGGARVWYIATSDGTVNETVALDSALSANVNTLITVDWPSCGSMILPSDATQIARYDRSVAYHDQLLTLRVLAWRER